MTNPVKSFLERYSFSPKPQTIQAIELRVSRTRKTIWGRRGRAGSFGERTSKPLSRNTSVSDFGEYESSEVDKKEKSSKIANRKPRAFPSITDFKP